MVFGLMFMVLINYFFLLIFEKETKCCFKPFFLVEFGMASCLARLRKKTFLVGFVVRLIMMAIFFWDCTFPPFVELRSQPEFLPLMSKDRTHWPRCLLWHGWLPGLSSRTLGTPWLFPPVTLLALVLRMLFVLILFLPLLPGILFWDQDDVQDMVDDVPDDPNIWTDGSREPIPHLDVEIAGAGAFIHSPAIVFDSHHWGHAQDLDDPHEGSSHIFSGIPGSIQSVQRAEYWGVILALQAYSGIHIGIDNLNVLRGVAALLSHQIPRSPLPLVKDGEFACHHSFYALPSWF